MSSDLSSIQSQFNLNSVNSNSESIYEFEDFRLDGARLMLYKNELPVALAPKVVETLLALVERGGEIVSKNEMMNRLWADLFVEESNLTQNIYLLRKTLGKTADGRDLIETFRRRGYRFNGEIHTTNGGDETEFYPSAEFISESVFESGDVPPAGRRKKKKNRLATAIFGLILVGGLIVLIWFAVNRSGLTLTTSAPVRSLAVMPLVNESGNANTEYLSDGLTESLITSLSQLPDLSVKARSSAFRYKGKDVPLKNIGAELLVEAILTGRVAEHGNELIINLELVDARTENVLWKADYNRSMANLSTLQNEITRDVAQKLRIKLTGANEQTFAKNKAAGSETYQLYLKGRYHLNKIIPIDLNKAAGYFEQAIAQDPNYAPAYAGLADAYVALAGFQGKFVLPPREYWAKAKQTVLKAVDLDPQSAVAQIAYANVVNSFDYNVEEANRACLTALQLDPSNAEAHALYGDVLYYYGRDEEAEAEHRRALELDPLSMRNAIKFGFFLGSIKKDDEAVALMKKAIDLDPKLPTPHFVLHRIYMAKGMHAEAVEEYLYIPRLFNYLDDEKKLEEAFEQGGWEGFLRAETERLLERRKINYVRASDLAILYMQLGDREKALEFLEEALYNREPLMVGMHRNRLFENLRADPRFTDLVRRIESK